MEWDFKKTLFKKEKKLIRSLNSLEACKKKISTLLPSCAAESMFFF
jgi:hypothetical protein